MRGYKIFGADYTYKYHDKTVKFSSTDINEYKYFSYCTNALHCLYRDNISSDNIYAIVESVDECENVYLNSTVFIAGKNDYSVSTNIVICDRFKIVNALTRSEFFEMIKPEILTLYTPVFPETVPDLTPDELSQLKQYRNTYENERDKWWTRWEECYTRYEINGKHMMSLSCFYKEGDKTPFVEYNQKEFRGHGYLHSGCFYTYTQCGKIDSIYYIHGKVFYKFAKYSKHGTLLRVNTYLDDSRYLTSIQRYFKNGKIRQNTEYNGDVEFPTGKCTRYYENGQLKQEFNYVNGEKHECKSYCKSEKVKINT